MNNTLEIELDDTSLAIVTYNIIKDDASFSHEFGIQKCYSYELEDLEIVSFERWDDEGETIVSTVPTSEDIKEINQKTFDKFIDSI